MADKDKDAANPAMSAPIGSRAKQVVLVVFEGVEAIDIAAPASAFSKATELVPGAYSITIASPLGGEVATNSGFTLGNTRALRSLTDPIDTVIVAGGDESALRTAILTHGVGEWVAQVAPTTRRVASVCTGAFVLASAGLLDNRQTTTHWRSCALLQSLCPKSHVQADTIYVHDGPIWTSAGVTTGLDLALALIEADLGRPVAVEIARNLALFIVRGGAHPQLSHALAAQAEASSRLRELIAWIMGHLADDLSVESLAKRVQMSPRNFARAFVTQAGSTPSQFVTRARVDHAAALLLQTDWPQNKIAHQSGFRSLDTLQCAFRKHLGVTPETYRSAVP